MITCVISSSYEERMRKIEEEKKKRGECEVVLCEQLSMNAWQTLPSTQSLFGEKKGYYVQDLEEYDDFVDIFFENIENYHTSQHTFLVAFSSLLKKQKEVLMKIGARIVEVSIKEEKEKPSFVFANAVLERDKKKAWQELQILLKEKTAEEIHGGVWSQIRNMILASQHAEGELDLHPFVYKNAKKALIKWSPEELLIHAKKIVDMPNKAHAGEIVLANELEKWILGL